LEPDFIASLQLNASLCGISVDSLRGFSPIND